MVNVAKYSIHGASGNSMVEAGSIYLYITGCAMSSLEFQPEKIGESLNHQETCYLAIFRVDFIHGNGWYLWWTPH